MNRQILGMLSVAAGVSVFSVQDVIVKFLSATYPVHQIVVVRSVVALPILLAVTLIEDGGKFRFHRLGFMPCAVSSSMRPTPPITWRWPA